MFTRVFLHLIIEFLLPVTFSGFVWSFFCLLKRPSGAWKSYGKYKLEWFLKKVQIYGLPFYSKISSGQLWFNMSTPSKNFSILTEFLDPVSANTKLHIPSVMDNLKRTCNWNSKFYIIMGLKSVDWMPVIYLSLLTTFCVQHARFML